MFRIGEFSKITQVPGSLLRYYHEIGLLEPAHTDEWTGYRYYSAQQIPRLNRILALKELGLTLEQIGRLVNDDVSADEIRGMLALKKAQVEQSVQDEIARLRHIEARLHQIETEGTMEDVDVVVKSIPEQPFLSIETTLGSFPDGYQLMLEMMRVLPGEVGRRTMEHFTAIMLGETFAFEQIDMAMGFTLAEPIDADVILPSGHVMARSTLPAAETMVTTVRLGRPQFGHKCYTALGMWIETNGYQFAGQGREVFIVPPLPGREDEAVVEIQYPVEPVDRATRLLS